MVPEEGLEPSQGYPYRILSLTTSETTTQISLKEPIISSCHDLNVWRMLEVSCYGTRTKGGRKTALNPLVHSNARRMFNPVRLSNYLCNKRYF